MKEKPNLTYINDLSEGDKSFKKKIITIIKEEFKIEKEIYLKNVAANNYKLTAQNVHKLKHKISILGLEKSFEIAASYEGNLKNKDKTLHEKFETILNNISDYLNKIH